MLCSRTVSLASFAVAAAIAGQPSSSCAQEASTRTRLPPPVAVSDVIKPNPHDGALHAPVMSDTWWIRMADGRGSGFQGASQNSVRANGAPPKVD
jgi:hypothetical protein